MADEQKVDHSTLIKQPEMFVVELVIDNTVYKSVVGGLNKESMISLLGIATAINNPRIAGWNLYSQAGECLASVDAMRFLSEISKNTPLGQRTADPKNAGWSAVPVVTPTSDEFQKMVEAAKREGRIPTGRNV